MSTNYHTPIPTGAPANASTFNAPLGELDGAISSVIGGGIPLSQLNLGDASPTLIINSDTITITRSYHTIDTESAAPTDDLATINGSSTGDLLILRIANSSRTVRIVNSGNIRTASGAPIILDSIDRVALFVYNGTNWVQNAVEILSAPASDDFLIPHARFAARAAARARTGFGARAAAAAFQPDSIAAPTASGTLTASLQADSAYVNAASAATAGAVAGLVTATFNLTRCAYNPRFDCLISTAAAADLANIRIWIGLFSAAPPNADALGSVSALAFRYSTVAPDDGWVAVASGASTQFTSSPLSGLLTPDTRYLLSIEVNAAAGSATFTINNNSAQATTITSSLPAATTNLGVAVHCITTVAAAKNFRISRFALEMD